LARKAKTEEATDIRNRIADPAAQKLVEWFILRRSETTATFSRYAAFIAANPQWPSAALLRRRAEARLWEERSAAATVRGFIGDRPTSAKGKLALARGLLAEGDRDGAARLARDAWRSDELSERLESEAPETMALQDTDQWWRERRSLARKLLDDGKFQAAYDVIRPAAAPANEYYRADVHFMCGWIALRYLDNPKTAATHFAHIDEGQTN